jgi:hypothetical protein
MAIGDAFAVFLGTAETSRQPSSGVEEQICAIVKQSATDTVSMFDGSNAVKTIGQFTTDTGIANDNQAGPEPFNQSLMITNSLYIRKDGTTDRYYFAGVQTNV